MKSDKKRKYTDKEIAEIVEKESAPSRERAEELKAELDDMIRENERLKKENAKYKEKQDDVIRALSTAKKQADEYTVKLSELYDCEVQRLKLFYLKWQSYFNYLSETYPNYRVTEKVKKIKEKLARLFGRTKSNKAEIDDIYSEIENETASTDVCFDPKAKINDYIQSESGFDMNKVLYPDESELDLEDLCKELGIN